MALSTLSSDEQRVILRHLRNALEPRVVMYFSSANKELRALLPPAAQRRLRTDHEKAKAQCVKPGMQDCTWSAGRGERTIRGQGWTSFSSRRFASA